MTLSRSTLADWVGRLGVALEPLWRRLAERLRQGTARHADDPKKLSYPTLFA